MRLGVALPVTVEGIWEHPETLERWARAVDAGPFAAITFGGRVAGEMPDVIALLGAVAGWTSRARIRAILTPQFYAPILLAKSLATVDRLIGGRLAVSLGVGARDDDYRALEIDVATQNVHQLAARARTMRWVWRGDHMTDTVRAIGPRPVRPDGPELLIASMGVQSARSGATWADGVDHVVLGTGERSLQDLAEVFDAARASWAEAGRAAPRLVTSFWFALEETAPQGARRQLDDHVRGYLDWASPAYVEGLLPEAGFVGTGAELVEVLGRLRELGVDEVDLIPTSADLAQVAALAAAVGNTFE